MSIAQDRELRARGVVRTRLLPDRGTSIQCDPHQTPGARQVLIVTSDVLARQVLSVCLATENGLAMLAQTGSVDEARLALPQADLAVIERALIDGDGLELAAELHAINQRTRALILVAPGEEGDAISQAPPRTVAGVLPRTATPEEVAVGLRRIADGGQILTSSDVMAVMRLVQQRRDENRDAQQRLRTLTPREWEVLRALAHGLNDQAIARMLHVSPNTVRAHMVSILQKLQVESRLEALVFLVRQGAIGIR